MYLCLLLKADQTAGSIALKCLGLAQQGLWINVKLKVIPKKT